MTTTTNNPWKNGTLFKTTASAQKAFSLRAGSFSDEQKEKASEYHNNVANADDRARVEALEGDESEIAAWYWEDSLRAE